MCIRDRIGNVYDVGILSKEEIKAKLGKMDYATFSINYLLELTAVDQFIELNVKDFDEKLKYSICHVDKSFGGKDKTAVTLAGLEKGVIYVKGFLFDDINKFAEQRHSIIDPRIPILSETNDDKGMSRSLLGNYITYHETEKLSLIHI